MRTTQILSPVLFMALFALASCHVPVFQNGLIRMVPGRRDQFGGFERFGFPGSMGGMQRFGFGFQGGPFQMPRDDISMGWGSNSRNMGWGNNNNMGLNSGVSQFSGPIMNNPGQWMGNQQTAFADPFAQAGVLQNPVGAGSNFGNPSVQGGLNTFASTPRMTGFGPGAGSQFPTIPNNNGAMDPSFGQFQGPSSMTGSQFNSQFSGANTGISGFSSNNGMPFSNNMNNGIGGKK